MEDIDKTICSCTYLSVYADRLLIQSRKVLHFGDIVCIKAIPCYFRSSQISEQNDVDYYIQIVLRTNKKVLLNDCDDHFIEAFKIYKNVTFNSRLAMDDIIPKFGKTKYIFASLLFELSPLKLVLWTK